LSLTYSQKITDDIDDEIGRRLRALGLIRTWNGEKMRLFSEVDELAKQERYLRFTGDFRDYHIEHKGSCCLYDIPPTQRGALQIYRGKRVRLICAGKTDARAGRLFFAKAVKASSRPTEQEANSAEGPYTAASKR
jgi:hypothetical protein